MKHFQRLFLLVLALTVGGRLGALFLSDFEPVKMILFALACIALGEVFYQIDTRFFRK